MNPTPELKNVGTSEAWIVIRKEDIRSISKNALCVQVFTFWHLSDPDAIGFVLYRKTRADIDSLYDDLMVEWETYLESV
jgi:hypothetical protein